MKEEILQTAAIQGIELSFVDTGERAALPLVLIHAFPLSHQMWSRQIPLLKKKYRILAPDIRGFGRSELGSRKPSIDQYVEDVFGLMDHAGIQAAVLVGLSMGGYVALRAKEMNAKRVHALVLADTKMEADSAEAKEKRFQTISELEARGSREFTQTFLSHCLSQETKDSKPEVLNELSQLVMNNSVDGICAALKAMAARKETSFALSKDPVPTLILVGQHDTITPLAAAELMKNHCPLAKLEVIAGAGHLSNIENSPAFNLALERMLAQLEY